MYEQMFAKRGGVFMAVALQLQKEVRECDTIKWVECPDIVETDWIKVDGLYLVNPSYIDHFKQLTQAD
jgi:hypothetical protein